MLEWWMPLAFEKYDRSTDPNEHLRTFVNTMTFYTASNPVWCRTSLSLKGETLTWFNTLPPNLVGNFSTICTLFGQQYAASKVQSLTHLALVNTKKEKDDSLRAFIFNLVNWSVDPKMEEDIEPNLDGSLFAYPWPLPLKDSLNESRSKVTIITWIRRRRDVQFVESIIE